MNAVVNPTAGQIFAHPRYYERPPGRWHLKYLLILGQDRRGDLLFRLLTSGGTHGPSPCYHGPLQAGYFLGILGAPLDQNTWVDLRKEDRTIEPPEFARKLARGDITLIRTLDVATMRAVIDCVSRAEDTSVGDASDLRDIIGAMDAAK